ncbi:MAG: hypothetical protein AAB300_04625 [Nitrospirota bacterium]
MRQEMQRQNLKNWLGGVFFVLMISVSELSWGMTPTPPMMSVQVAPQSTITGLGAETQDGLGVNLLMRYGSRSELQSGKDKVSNPNNEETRTRQTTLLLDYRVADKLTAILAIPHINHYVSYGNVTQTSQGLGDIVLYGKYSLYRHQMMNTSREVLVLAGVEFPSGSTDESDASGQFPASQQLGSGSTDFIVGGAIVSGGQTITTYGDFSYKINGDKSYSFGNFFSLNGGMNYTIPQQPRFSLVGELNVEVAAQDQSDIAGPGVLPSGKVRDTGYKKLFVSPGLQYRPGGNWTVNFGVQVPVVQDLRGTQLASEVNYSFGISTRFGSRMMAMKNKR